MKYIEMIEDLPTVVFEDYMAGKVSLDQFYSFLRVLEDLNAMLEEFEK